ncbi:hypothetical protein [Phyllobacterium sp. P5_D12]
MYWGKVAKRALLESLELIRLDNPWRTTVTLGVAASVGVLGYILSSSLDGLVRAAYAVGAVALVGFILFLVKLVTVPPKVATEADARVKEWSQKYEALSQHSNDNLRAHRELAWIAARFIIHAMNEAQRGNWHDAEAADFQICEEALNRVPFEAIRPAHLIECFVEIKHMVVRAAKITKGHGEDQQKIQETIQRTRSAMGRIDLALPTSANDAVEV